MKDDNTNNQFMKIVGIDFGLKKVGIAIADGSLAEPLVVVRYNDSKILLGEIKKIVEKEKIEKIVVGISEGEMAEKTREFMGELKKEIAISVEEFDETLSTLDAQRLAIESGMKRAKRRKMEDALAAAVMLQSYVDCFE